MDNPPRPPHSAPHGLPQRVHGRGAQSDAVPTRFRLATREVDGNWRDHAEKLTREEGRPPVKLRTTVIEERPKPILRFNRSPGIGFAPSVNACRGCEQSYTVVRTQNQ